MLNGRSLPSLKQSNRHLVRAYFRSLRDLGEREVYCEGLCLGRDMPTAGDSWRESGASSRESGASSLESLAESIRHCRKCALHKGRTNPVPGAGNPRTGLVMVGEAPGQQEDRQGLPFVGPSGQLLRRLFSMAGIPESGYYLVNILKCRPPGNRDPLAEEVEACLPFLEAQLAILAPRLIVCLGRIAGWHVLGQGEQLMRDMRGAVHQRGGASVMVTYHPSALLHKPEFRAEAWRDVKRIRHAAHRLGVPTELSHGG